jgi:hypothetical protein
MRRWFEWLRALRTKPTPPGTGPTVVYAPHHDGRADPGEVVWAWLPNEDDPTQGKDRPVLVIGVDGSELVGVPLSSKDHDDRRDHAEWVDVGTGTWDGQHRESHANASRLLRYDAGEVRREGGTLDRARFDDVVARVRSLHPEVQ